MPRAIVIVMDGCGAGEAPDANRFGDFDHPDTVRHVWNAVGGLHAPNLDTVGFFAACGIESETPKTGRYGRLREVSLGGKDSVTGHWELAGVVSPEPFPTYPDGFPADLVAEFEKRIGRQIIGNKPASGTAIIAELGGEHMASGKPILYTSADSVFQVACHEEVIPIERLYEICEIGRELCVGAHGVQRVIARPFLGSPEVGFTRTERRKDYPLSPPNNLIDVVGDVYGVGVIPELFNGRGFRKTPRTQSNAEHEIALFEALRSDARFIWANFEDFDMLYGHRNDAPGFAKCIERFDQTLGKVRELLREDDLLVLTADHGNDPTTPGTDHSREYVPVVLIGKGVKAGPIGDVEGMHSVAATVAQHLGLDWSAGVPALS